MNIKAFSSLLDQQPPINNKGSSKTGESIDSEFGQLLQALAATTPEQADQQEDLLTANAGAIWLQLLLTPFGQQLNEQLPTPDLALSLNNGEQEEGSAKEMISVSLTEIMAALQPLIGQSNTPLLPQPNGSLDETVHFSLAVTNETNKANTLLLPGLLTTIPQVKDVSVSPDETGQPLNTIDTLLTQSQPEDVATGNTAAAPSLQSQKDVTGNLQTARIVDLSTTPNVAATHSTSTAVDAVEPLPNSKAVHNTIPVADALPPQPQTSTPTEIPSVIPQPTAASVTAPLPGPQPTNIESTSTFQLPDIPALHQITDSVGILNRQGQTEVRLHLQPATLGHLWVQLHIADGNVAVQMLAETPQAQALIQDHLAQLKMAFAARGLQIDGLSVAVGQDNPAFNLSERRSNGGSNRSNWQQSHSSIYELEQATDSRPTTNLWGILRAVDYHV